MRTLPPMDDEQPPRPLKPDDLDVDRKRIYGPVYLFIAHDPEQGFIEAYLYFPSMTKDREKWPTYHFLGVAHSWMYRLMYSPDYNILLPNTNCGRRLRDPRHTLDFEQRRLETEKELKEWREKPKSELPEAPKKIAELEKELDGMSDVLKSMGMEIGCRTDWSYSCVQSKRAHKMMRLYRRRKPITQYPHIYFRMYQLNLDDKRFVRFVKSNEFTQVRRDILPSGVDMFTGCRYMLVSPNKKYFLVLSNSWLTVFWNYGDENLELLCRFNRSPIMSMAVRTIPFYGETASHMIIEDGQMNIYSEITEMETLVYSREVVAPDAQSPYAMVLQNNGTLVIYDSKSKIISSKDGLMSDTADDVLLSGDYDPVEDYRRRIINLIAYLRMYNLYQEIEANKKSLPQDVAMYILQEGIPPYNALLDYQERLENLVKYLIARGYKNLIVAAAEKSDPSMQVSQVVAEDPKKKDKSSKKSNPKKVDRDSIQPKSTTWQKPDKEVDPNPNADPEICAGLQDEALADCQDAAEAVEVAQETQSDTNAQTSEYTLINSTNPMDAGVDMSALSDSKKGAGSDSNKSRSKKMKGFSDSDYQKALAICRVASANNTYVYDQDLYCRLVALKEYLRKYGYAVIEPEEVDPTATTETATQKRQRAANKNIEVGIPDYNQPVDFATRLQATRNLFPKSQGNA